MATALPTELWEKIVEQLPSPPPRLVPCIAVHTGKAGDEYCCVFVSKTVSEDEVNCIMQHLKSHGAYPDRYEYTVRFHHVDYIVNRAFMYGWDFSSEFDRQSYESRGRTFRLIRKSI